MKELLDSCPQEPVVFEQEFFPEDMLIGENLPYTVEEQSPENPTIFVVEGPKIEKMLGYTNLDSEKVSHSSRNLERGRHPGRT